MMKAIIAALFLCSCLGGTAVPTNTEYQRNALEEYRAGKISWAEYQEVLKHEKESEGQP